MGSFVFKWEHSASEVYVTGTFDEWKKTERLEKIGEHFEKLVMLPDASQKIYYKFVVDGNWVTDHTAPKEADESGNENNVLTPENIQKAPVTMNSAAPESSTAALAAGVPLEKKEENHDDLPGAFPETPAALEPKDQEFSVNPLPAAPGAVNPVQLAPGEKIPEGLAVGDTTSHVKLDAESYEKADELPGGAALTFSSAAPESSTAALAAGAPIETKVPAVVKESQEKAHVDAEASGVPEEVKEKAAVEEELLEKVTPAPTTAEGTSGVGTEKTETTVTPGEAAGSVVAAAAALGSAAVAGAIGAKDIAVEKADQAITTAQVSATEAATNLPDSVKEKLPASVQSAIGTTAKEEKIETVSPEVPVEVKDSIAEAGKAPEAASNTEAVEEKKAVETELLKEVKPVASVGEEAKVGGASSKSETEPKPTTEAAPEESKPTTAVIPTEPVPATDAIPAIVTEPAAEAAPEPNGAQAAVTPEKSAAGPSTADPSPATEKKKKNRLSALFSKFRGKKAAK
ncbi:uncharacterized protein BCR38DRAFT_191409 [Pseudomassariella vexata]|uniref:AMP-activated protein kinase glycogen-binding domain-containing protein n=1 Tax=Pseudomassariella vexata TaxID=1141098 RepID=A0A1Y2E0N1_9PEZI|nr:uncharacterized protein BCR38DRAFT_191409 [Pseudomassariella vexata]ORY65101.1 hypothetical protein BCR38DRAFT_191409 [Pseudomassariella vexata]